MLNSYLVLNLQQNIRKISIPFSTSSSAEIAYNVLRVDAEPPRSHVEKKLELDAKTLHVQFEASMSKHVRVAVTAFFENLRLIVDTIALLGPPIEKQS